MNKNTLRKGINLRWYFTAYIFAVITGTSVVLGLIIFFFSRLISSAIDLPVYIWIPLVSIIVGAGVTAFTSKRILLPITRLSNAMAKVSGGDYSVRLNCISRIAEIQDSYNSFNLMAKELSAVEMLQSDFISGVSHEFKTPISAIEGYVTLLQDTPGQTAEQREYVDKILFSTRRLSQLVGNILLLSKVDHKAIPAEKTSFRLDEQIRQAILSLETKWTGKNIDLDVELDEVNITGCESMLYHVWTNLIDNAVKFSPAGGEVAIKLSSYDGYARVTVSDSGPGITGEEALHIYDRFYQADGSHKSEGNGLGLALVRRILDSCAGSIALSSGKDCGTQFTVTIPVS